MATGIETYNSDGSINISMTGNLCHMLGSFVIVINSNSGSGSKTISVDTGYTLFYYPVSPQDGYWEFPEKPLIWQNGNTIYWSWSDNESYHYKNTTIYYGEY